MLNTVANPTALAATPSPSARVVTVTVHGTPVPIPCPSWCLLDHTDPRYDEVFLEDVYHRSAYIQLPVPVYGGGVEYVLNAWVTQYPFSTEETTRPYLAVDGAADGETAELDAPAALAMADQVQAHATALRAMARTLAGAR